MADKEARREIEETAQLEVERMLRKASVEELSSIAASMDIEEVEGLAKVPLLRKIQECFDQACSGTTSILTLFEILALPDRMGSHMTRILGEAKLQLQTKEQNAGIVEGVSEEKGEGTVQALMSQQAQLLKLQNELKEENEKRQEEFEYEVQDRMRLEIEVRKRLEQEDSKKRSDSAASTLDAMRSLGFKRELKIQGIIGGKGDARLTYLSLCSQVSEAKGKGYTDYEVIFALRRAVTPGSELRQYLDAMDHQISLEDMLAFIRSSYKEKQASELFQDLNKLCQRCDEDNQAFLFRALSLRQRVVAAAMVEDAVKYDKGLIQSVFKRSVLTGLRSEAVRAHMKVSLSPRSNKTDTELIEELNKISAEETERISKQTATSHDKKANVNELVVSVEKQICSGIEKAVKPLTDTISDLSQQLKQMQTELEEMKSARPRQQRRIRGCKECIAKKQFCKHCFKCGKDGHMLTECKSSN